MSQFSSFSSDDKVKGNWIQVFHKISSPISDKLKHSLSKNDIFNASSEKWYCLQNYLEVFKEIAKTHTPNTFFKMGKLLFQSLNFPKEARDIEAAIKILNQHYQETHKGSGTGYYKVLKVNKERQEIIVECKNPYPCYLDRGILTALTKKYKPEKARIFHIELNTSLPNRLAGSNKSTYMIAWN